MVIVDGKCVERYVFSAEYKLHVRVDQYAIEP